MLVPVSRVRIFVCRDAVDMRKSFDGLCGLVRSILNEDPLSGHVFLFTNRTRNYVKLLWWDRTGYCITAKRLARGRFGQIDRAQLNTAELLQILEGMSVTTRRCSKLYEHLPE